MKGICAWDLERYPWTREPVPVIVRERVRRPLVTVFFWIIAVLRLCGGRDWIEVNGTGNTSRNECLIAVLSEERTFRRIGTAIRLLVHCVWRGAAPCLGLCVCSVRDSVSCSDRVGLSTQGIIAN